MGIHSIEKILLRGLLFFTWKNGYGSRLKYRLKKRPFTYEYLNWNIALYKSQPIIKVGSWSKFISLNRYSESDINFSNEGVADPFLVTFDNGIYLFYEAIKNGKGEIWSKKLFHDKWLRPKKIIVEDYHLSYPFIFKENDTLYMLPESSQNKDVRLYKCVEFPDIWEIEAILQNNVTFVDTNLLIIDGIYFWLTYDTTLKKERIFYSTSLKSNWVEHCCSNKNNYRNAGPIFMEDEVWYRPIQKSYGKYGEGVALLKIEDISVNTYRDSMAVESFLEKKSGFSLDGTHHISTLKTGNGYLIAVDGKNRNYYKVF